MNFYHKVLGTGCYLNYGIMATLNNSYLHNYYFECNCCNLLTVWSTKLTNFNGLGPMCLSTCRPSNRKKSLEYGVFVAYESMTVPCWLVHPSRILNRIVIIGQIDLFAGRNGFSESYAVTAFTGVTRGRKILLVLNNILIIIIHRAYNKCANSRTWRPTFSVLIGARTNSLRSFNFAGQIENFVTWNEFWEQAVRLKISQKSIKFGQILQYNFFENVC